MTTSTFHPLLLILTFSITALSPFANLLSARLQARFDSIAPGGKLSIQVYSLNQEKSEVNLDENGWYTPASCLKLVTTAAAITAFKPNHFFETKVEAWGKITGKTLQGHLSVTGGGDPNISGRFFPDEQDAMRSWVREIKTAGIDTLVGMIQFDGDLFAGPSRPSSWSSRHFERWFGAETSAFTYNDNCAKIEVYPGESEKDTVTVKIFPDIGHILVRSSVETVKGKQNKVKIELHKDSSVVFLNGSLGMESARAEFVFPVRQPKEYFRKAFLKSLQLEGVVYLVEKEPQKGSFHRKWSFKTVPVTNIIEEVNQRSQNLHAETLLRQMGVQKLGESDWNSSIKAEKQYLAEIGVDTSSFKIQDGSGLSHSTKLKPKAFINLLALMARHPYSNDYIQSLATPGLHGVSGSRIRGLQGLVKYKSGYIHAVQGLSGYVFASDGDTLCFTIFMNGYNVNAKIAASLVDTLIYDIAWWYNQERSGLGLAEKLLNERAPEHYLDRLRHFARRLEGTDYFLGPTGEGRYSDIEVNPLFDLTRVDCVTYMEAVLALAKAKTKKDLIPILTDLRYEGPISYSTRKHYFAEDWLGKNPNWVHTLRLKGDTTEYKTTDKIKFFKSKNLPAPSINPITQLTYLPYQKALETARNWEYGKRFLGVAFVTSIPGIWITHTGFLDATEGGTPILRHAGSKAGKAVAEDFAKYLESRQGRCAGVAFFEFVPQNRN